MAPEAHLGLRTTERLHRLMLCGHLLMQVSQTLSIEVRSED
jgi:hypothetical protein